MFNLYYSSTTCNLEYNIHFQDGCDIHFFVCWLILHVFFYLVHPSIYYRPHFAIRYANKQTRNSKHYCDNGNLHRQVHTLHQIAMLHRSSSTATIITTPVSWEGSIMIKDNGS